MGLAVSQVRLLALTTRKADIELQMQVNSKRKQMLTRKSTELAQQYYSRLQNASIQYATSSGYEDVNVNYLMGQTSNEMITDSFWSQIATGSSQGIAQKTEPRMILTNQYGEVVINNELVIAAEKAKDSYASKTTSEQASYAILDLIRNNQNNQTLAALNSKLSLLGEDNIIKYMDLMFKNGGYQTGGIVYQATNGVYYRSAAAAKTCSPEDIVKLQPGVCYELRNHNATIVHSACFYDGANFVSDFTTTYAKYLGNLINYFGPMLTAALQNGTTADVSKTALLNEKTVNAPTDTAMNDERLRLYADGELGTNECCKFVYNNEIRYFQKSATGVTSEVLAKNYYDYKVVKNDGYVNASNTEKLQAGFKSGVFQLCMVTDPGKGIYHKNTTLDYFIHMNHVVEKTDTSEREEITAWFNAEQALISEQETYWDAEIQNLSTELNSVNTEIESVKSLKSNAIKSVFDWGGS